MKLESGVVSAREARDNWRDVLDYVIGGQHVVITRNGKRVVALIPIEDFARYSDELEDLALGREMAQKYEKALDEGETWALRLKMLAQEEREAKAILEQSKEEIPA